MDCQNLVMMKEERGVEEWKTDGGSSNGELCQRDTIPN